MMECGCVVFHNAEKSMLKYMLMMNIDISDISLFEEQREWDIRERRKEKGGLVWSSQAVSSRGGLT